FQRWEGQAARLECRHELTEGGVMAVLKRTGTGDARSGRRVAALAAGGVLLAAAFGVAQAPPESARVATKRFDMRVVATGLDNPWEVTLGPDGMLWVTERSALRVTRVDPQTGERHVAATLSDIAKAAGPGGVLGMALHPGLLRD